MKTKLFVLSVLLFGFTFSAARGDEYSHHYDKSVVEGLSGRVLPFDGPNCVDAAMISQNPQFPFMMVDPKFAQKNILPQCFEEVGKPTADLVGYFNTKSELIHIFTLLDNGKVFSKNGLDGNDAIKISTEDEIHESYKEHIATTKYFRWAPTENCLVVSFPKYVDSVPTLRRIEASIQDTIFGRSSADPEIKYSALLDLYQSLHAQDSTTELVKELIWTAFALPQYEEARNKEEIAQYLKGMSVGLHISDKEVTERLGELKNLYLYTLSIFSINGTSDDLVKMLENYKTFHIVGYNNQVPEVLGSMGCPLTQDECIPLWEKVKAIKDEISAKGIIYSKDGMSIDTKSWLLTVNKHTYHFQRIGVYTPSK
jgi:hypothetical protein